eukprot:scaffold83677_cov46-Cyclotella_meneghiniana.AAC.2
MTDYNIIFGGILLFNVLVTFRASSYWSKYFPKSTAEEQNTDENEAEDLIDNKDAADIEAGK